MAWLDRVAAGEGPIYLAVLRALEQAIRGGELHPGDRLPPQRAVAERLGVDLTTVTRAYSAAQGQGLVEGAVGRGTYVRPQAGDDDPGLVDLSMNLPPPPEGLSLGRLLQETTAAILERSDPATLMAYHPGFGTVGQRKAGAQWLAPVLGEVAAERLLLSPGAQAALAAVLSCLCRPGDTVVAEPLTYPGFIGVARQLGLKVLACEVDAEGLVPEALEALCAKARPRAIYLVPTMQNPTGTTMAPERRAALARIAAARELWIVEDDPYSRLMEQPPAAIAAVAPDRTFHVATLAKCLSPGLRIAYLACPAAWAERVAEALRALALMPPPLMAAVATRWIQEGAADRLLGAVRAETRARRAIAARALPQAIGGAQNIHLWLPMADTPSAERIQLAAQARGLAVVTAEAFAVDPAHPAGARISLGGPGKRAVLERALATLAELVASGGRPQRVIV
ncbi:MAG TPA: PLP-dependent aminotransferase family protein [Phenylobacterium sp.]|uniref:aminotransferase-like domain-containing protein n=1 Tax=Phenylobacterium sp. TaxID=1871053 RepID=UPI002B48F42A|nr:PLP-dependent aminotransferase family protein [Phenylobacterium sp.]HKR87251.1 PLP-dependent aminotransferase family protein [Phenylobacterium sp.]